MKQLILIILIVTALTYIPGVARSGSSLLIVATFPSLVADLEQIVDGYSDVVSLIPSGVDPHEYSLKPDDVDLLRKADLIISTGHTHFEKQISDLVSRGEIKARLVEITRIPGIELKLNPALNKPNYHMPIYDPGNYRVFLRYVVDQLVEIDPLNKRYYEERLGEVLDRLDKIVSSTPRLDVEAVVDTPVTQYGVEWIGVRVKYLVLKEHDVQVAPDLMIIEEKLRSGEVGLAVVTYPVKMEPSKWLVRKAVEYGVPILYVPSPLLNKSIVDKLENISLQIRELGLGVGGEHGSNTALPDTYLVNYLSMGVGSLVLALMIYVLGFRRDGL